VSGDARANLQILRGDRLVVGFRQIVQKTIELDRVAAPFQTPSQSLAQYAQAVRSISPASVALPATDAQRDAFVKEWANFQWKIASSRAESKLDEKMFKDLPPRSLQIPAEPTLAPK
jgi:hypothetical protein